MNKTIPSHPQQSQSMGFREHKKRQAQAVIEEVALRLFHLHGYEQTTIQDIADAVQMSPRTFFRYFASKEEVLSGPMYATRNDGIRFLQDLSPTETPHAALRAISLHLADLYQQQRTSFLIRYQVAAQTSSIASIYVYVLLETEQTLCDALCSRLEAAKNYNQMRLLVGLYMTTFRVAVEGWVKNGAQEDLLSLLREHLDYLSSLSH